MIESHLTHTPIDGIYLSWLSEFDDDPLFRYDCGLAFDGGSGTYNCYPGVVRVNMNVVGWIRHPEGFKNWWVV